MKAIWDIEITDKLEIENRNIFERMGDGEKGLVGS